jgi:hypothetical protein
MDFAAFNTLAPYVLSFIAIGLSAGCQHECTGEDVPKVDVLVMRADLACPSATDAQTLLNAEFGSGDKVVSPAGTMMDFQSRQICWYRAQEPVPYGLCLDQDSHESIEEILALRSRTYYRVQGMAASGPANVSFVYSVVESCDASGRLYGVIRAPGDFSACPVDPPADSMDHLTLSGLVGFDVIPERIGCRYNATFRYMCGGIALPGGVFSPP